MVWLREQEKLEYFTHEEECRTYLVEEALLKGSRTYRDLEVKKGQTGGCGKTRGFAGTGRRGERCIPLRRFRAKT
jgi:hypothetical protein